MQRARKKNRFSLPHALVGAQRRIAPFFLFFFTSFWFFGLSSLYLGPFLSTPAGILFFFDP